DGKLPEAPLFDNQPNPRSQRSANLKTLGPCMFGSHYFSLSRQRYSILLLLEINILISRLKTVSQSSDQLLPLKVRKLLIIMGRVPLLDRIEINNPIKRFSVPKTPSFCYVTILF